MADYDSDSSGADDVETNVLLGYASREPTVDDFSQLGGHPTWLDELTAPSGALATCKVCNGLTNLILQLNGDLPDRFPSHERRLYLWTCRKKTCRRKDGSVRGFRATRRSPQQSSHRAMSGPEDKSAPAKRPAMDLGSTLFGVKSSSNAQANPFATSSSNSACSNAFAAGADQMDPFAAAATLAAKPPQRPESMDTLPETFAQKARIASPNQASQDTPPAPTEPWPSSSAFPGPFPSYHLDADKEYIDPDSSQPPANVRLDRDAMETAEGSGNGAADDKAAFESSMDKTFQRFADRLAQNPEQVLRYEYAGQPLLYSKTDAVGKMLSPAQESINAKVRTAGGAGQARLPRCANCGAERVFEMQLTPHAITELEAEEITVEGMDWGTVIFGVCSQDCQQKGVSDGEVGYVEEWVGVQWEEMANNKRPA